MGAKLRVAGWLAVGAVAGALTTMQLQATARNGISQLPLEELQQMAAVFGMIKSDYVDPVDEKKLIGDAIGGMVSGLDPHSQYFDKKTFKEFREATTGRFVGIGIEMAMEDGLVKVVSPIEGSPAFRAGMKSGDLITKIDDTLVKGLTVDQAVKKMRGEPNTKVVLMVFRKSESRSFPVTIVREEIRTQSVRAKIIEPGYAWLRVSQFQDRTVEDFAKKLEDIYKQEPNLKGLVLDLRNDPGGLLEGAVAVASAFLPADDVVVSTNGQIPDSKQTFKANPSDYLRRGGSDPLKRLPEAVKHVPLILLVNEGSASASEIVAGAGPQARDADGRTDLRQGLGADGAPAFARHRAEDHHRALLHPERCLDPGQGHRARRDAGRNRRGQSVRRAAHPRGRSGQAHRERPGHRAERRSAREGARGSAQEARGRHRQAEHQGPEAAAGVRFARGLPARAGAQPAEGQAGAGQQDRRRTQARDRDDELGGSDPAFRHLPENARARRGRFRILRPRTYSAMNDDQLLRYSRHLLLEDLGIEGQQRLLAAHALVIGAGGLGSPVALYLATAGVGRITIVDGDRVDLTNLQRQIAHTLAGLGQPKASSAAAAIHALNPDVQVTALHERADASRLDALVAAADVVVDCSDNFATRQAINAACVAHAKPLVAGAAIGFDGQVSVYDTRAATSPCYACLFPTDAPVEEVACSTMGVFAPLVGIVGSVQAAEALKLLAGVGRSLAGRLQMLDARTMEWTEIAIRRAPRCPVCGDSSRSSK